MNILRRVSLARLLLVCGLVIAIGVSATAIASGLNTGPTPPLQPLADAAHQALSAPAVQGVSARVQLTNHLLEGANLASGGSSGGLTSSPLVSGGSGRLWIGDGHARLELQAQGGAGDTQVLFDGHTLQVYDAATNTLYRYTPPAKEGASPSGSDGSTANAPLAGSSGEDEASEHHEVPSVAKIEEAISHLGEHANVSGAMPTDVAGQPAYTVRVSPKQDGSLLGGVELSFDADNGVPLRAAIYSSTTSSPALELAASEVSFGPVESSVFAFAPPANAKVKEVSFANGQGGSAQTGPSEKPTLTTHGQGPSTVAVLESKAATGATGSSGTSESGASATSESLPKVTINGVSASELKTELGTLLTFERSGVRYVVAGAVPAAAVEEVARGL